jgi:light-regulated signal transduction histidine kinase (bacteriophytochrome)
MNKHKRTIAIIGGNPEERATYQSYLQQARYTYQVLEATDGATGLALCQQAQPDVILLDYALPDLDGLQFLRALMAQTGQVPLPVVMLTESGDAAIADQIMQQGAQDELIKSELTPRGLCRTIDHAVERMRLLINLRRTEAELRYQRERAELFANITLKLRQSLQSDEILQTAVTEVQHLLQADRVLIFRLWPDGSGRVIQESVVPGVSVTLGQDIFDPCFADYLDQYQQGRIRTITDVTTADIKDCYVEFLQNLAVKANLVVPILIRETLWGLLIAHQCTAPREWLPPETELLELLANQIGIALSQAEQLAQETRQREELARSNTELERFAYVASHDLQEPLRMVTSYLQLLEQVYGSQLDAEAQEYIQFAVNGATRMRILIQDLLMYSRVNMRIQTFAPIQADTSLERAIANLQLAIAESGATIQSEPLPEVAADGTQLAQLFQNLLSNAIKFRQVDRPLQIQVGATRQTSEWLFWIRDNGIGIAPQYTERIFLIFQRLHHQADYPGTGIGLAVCKKIVERHGGRLWVESEPAQGSIFCFTIPDPTHPLS